MPEYPEVVFKVTPKKTLRSSVKHGNIYRRWDVNVI